MVKIMMLSLILLIGCSANHPPVKHRCKWAKIRLYPITIKTDNVGGLDPKSTNEVIKALRYYRKEIERLNNHAN